jgi:hypothetical protein
MSYWLEALNNTYKNKYIDIVAGGIIFSDPRE